MGRYSASSVTTSNRPLPTSRSTTRSASASIRGVTSRIRSGRSGRPSTERIAVCSGGSLQSVIPSSWAFTSGSTNTPRAEENVCQSIREARTSS
ncbi:hypothetical protein, partial [Streptomyces flavovirens]|uniref:hypothetical protein n=1 Tax=Streptomyces flavovirens TaxID=52258 RepID=UPI0031F0A4DC